MSLQHSARLLFTHHRLLWRVTRTELAARHAGSILGQGWVLVFPLLVLGVYASVYLLIFRVRVPGLSPLDYVLYISSGLVPFLATAEALSAGVASVVANRAVVTSTVFPIDLVPVKAVLCSQATMVVGLAVVLGAALFTRGVSWSLLGLPVTWVLYLLAMIGLNWILSLINVVLRDLQTIVNVALMLVFVASPIAYTPEMVPAELGFLVALNPFAYFITAFQKILILQELPGAGHAAVLVVLSVAVFAAGGWFFARAKRVLVDYV